MSKVGMVRHLRFFGAWSDGGDCQIAGMWTKMRRLFLASGSPYAGARAIAQRTRVAQPPVTAWGERPLLSAVVTFGETY
ncbi:hypothetical protein OKW26_004070 [Paraburkholderia sp. 32]